MPSEDSIFTPTPVVDSKSVTSYFQESTKEKCSKDQFLKKIDEVKCLASIVDDELELGEANSHLKLCMKILEAKTKVPKPFK